MTDHPPQERFWVYENHVWSYARIHRGSCGSCNHGHGVHGKGGAARTGRWSGPYDDAEAATAAAMATGKEHVLGCMVCNPSRGK